jgi:hypothetical protein
MKIKFPLLFLVLSLIINTGFSQEKTSKELRKERKIEDQNRIAALVNSKDFIFIASTALPMGFKSVNISGNSYYVKFHPDLIESIMPFFGKGYSAVAIGDDTGLRFTGKPEDFTLLKNKKNYQIEVVVKGTRDIYHLFLSLGFEGSGSLTITSNNRGTISYQGEIFPSTKADGKKQPSN